MKKLVLIIIFLFSIQTTATTLNIKDMSGQNLTINSKHKATLVVNIATQCGYTPQLESLQKLYMKYKNQGLQIIGIPSNDFGGQTPQSNKNVKKFCKLNYGVTFPLTTKSSVKGKNKIPFISKIISMSNTTKEISWNFEKFLIKSNNTVLRFNSRVEPLNSTLESQIQQALKD